MPRGGRLLMTQNGNPALRSDATAARVAAVTTFWVVTRVPSRSETMAEIFVAGGRGGHAGR